MAYIQEKVKGKKIVSFKFKACLGRDANGKQIFKCWTWYPPADLTPAKARKEADRVAARWEEEQRLAFSQQKAEEETTLKVEHLLLQGEPYKKISQNPIGQVLKGLIQK